MSPFKKAGRRNYYVWPTLPRFGRIGPYSTGTTDRTLARDMEAMLRELSMSRPALIEALVRRDLTVPDLWVAKLQNQLDRIEQQAGDPPLTEAAERFRPLIKNRRVRDGLNHLHRLAPKGARLSWLLESKNISDICARMVGEGYAPNSVGRSLYRAIADLLAYEVGKARRAAIFADVVKPYVDDSRNVVAMPDEIARILEACDAEFRPVVQLALLTGIDRGPLAELRVRHFDEAAGTLLVPDRKARSRYRTLQLSGAALAILRRQTAGKKPDERVFRPTYGAMGYRWTQARKAAGREDLRFKDLRHLFADAWTRTGGTLKDLMPILGHTQQQTTMRYTSAQATRAREQMDRIADALGLGRAHLNIEKGGA